MSTEPSVDDILNSIAESLPPNFFKPPTKKQKFDDSIGVSTEGIDEFGINRNPDNVPESVCEQKLHTAALAGSAFTPHHLNEINARKETLQFEPVSLVPTIPSEAQSNPVVKSESDAMEMQRRINALLSSIGCQVQPCNDSLARTYPDSGLTSEGTHTAVGIDVGGSWGSQNPNTTSEYGHQKGFKHRGRSKTHNQDWFVDYYDPSFNQNPWEKLERQYGM
ncbi:BgTH12-03099 [Blumeria graminis f. sp. triticale]|uniref:BgTH12-03099 n=1 Tax=Blumeria graminis f. sp. triticale TaxID=1689686 RepID=A0A9W4D3I3_BLUGR|nr:BgTH12-03099 [Blumeria graminis f. sp. triticale]